MKSALQFTLLIVLVVFYFQADCQSLNSPESVVFDAPRNRYLISNAGNGTILAYNYSTYSTFASGLSSPKGMVVIGNYLYVTDVTRVMGFNLVNGATVMNLNINGASFLNDITTDNSQYLYVSDMNNNNIIRVNYKNYTYTTFASSGLNKPNGLLYDVKNSRLIVCSYINNAPIQSVSLSNGTVSTIVTTSLSNLDGLTVDDSGYIYVSAWGTNAVYRFSSDFTTGPVLYASGFNGPADIFYNPEAKVLAIPGMNNNQLNFKDMLYAVINPQGKTDICPGADVLLKTATGSALSYVWKLNGNVVGTVSSYLAYQQGSYTVTITNHLGTKTSSPVQVNLYQKPPAPTIQIYGNVSFCLGDSVVLEGPSGYNYFWSDSQTTQKIIVRQSGSYKLMVIDTNQCKSDYSAEVKTTRHPAIVKPVISYTKTEICRGDSIILEGPSGYSYIWSNGKTTQQIIVKDKLTVSLIIYDNSYCQSYPSDSVEIIVYENPPKPKLIVSGKTEFCNGDSVLITAPSGYKSYLWNNNSIKESQLALVSDTFFVRVTDSNACVSPNSDTIIVLVHGLPSKPVISWTNQLTFCNGDSIELAAPPGYVKYFWNNQEGNEKITVKETDSFTLYVIDSNNCVSPVSEKVYTLRRENPVKPQIVFVYGSKMFCEGDSAVLSTHLNYVSYLWSTGWDKKQLTVNQTDTLSVKVWDQYGCYNVSDDVFISVLKIPAKPQVLKYNKDSLFCSVEGSSYKWIYNGMSLAFTGRVIPILGDGAYRVIVFNEICASDTSEVYNYVAGSLQEDLKNQLMVFPNPAISVINIELKGWEKIYAYRLMDISGKVMLANISDKAANKLILNVSDFPKGIYFIEIQSDKKRLTRMFMVD